MIWDDERDPWRRRTMRPEDDGKVGGGPVDTAPGPSDLGPMGADPGSEPQYVPPFDYEPPPYTGPQSYNIPNLPQFRGPDFDAPSYEEAMADPGYQFALQEGNRAMQQSAAARGVLRTGGTLKDLINYGQAAAGQQYENVYRRARDTYDADYRRAYDRYASRLPYWQELVNRNRDLWGAGREDYWRRLDDIFRREQMLYG